jgi:signal transduction histidine kinase
MTPAPAAALSAPAFPSSAFPSEAVAAMAAGMGVGACAVFDAEDRLVWANDAAARLMAALGAGAFGSAADRRGAAGAGRAARRRFEIGPDGARRTLTARFAAVPGAAGQVFCAVVDATSEARAVRALRQVTQRADDLVMLLSDCIWETDAEGRLVHFTLRHADPEAARALVGRSLFEVGAFDPAPRGAAGGAARGFARPPTPRSRALFRDAVFRMTLAGADRVFLLAGMPLFDEETGAFLGFRGAGDEITERLRAEAAEAAARGQLEARNAELDSALTAAQAAARAKSEFLARMSHELRTPLNAVLGLSAVLKHGLGDRADDRQARCLDEIAGAGRHLLALVTDVLEMAEERADPAALDRAPCDPAALAAEAAQAQGAAAAARGVRLAVEAAPGLALTADGARLGRALWHLLDNAVKFSPRGGTVALRVWADDGRLWIEVRDDGPGVPAGMRARVTEPFFQADGGATRSHGGVGVGLALCARVAAMHGGGVEIGGGEGGEGAVVRLWLPAG